MINIHFLNVGQGDCTIIHFPERIRTDGKTKSERIMMVDLYHRENDSFYEDVIEYYKRNFKNPDGTLKPIFRLVCTHPHQDHICGLNKLLEESGIGVLNFWDLDHNFEPETFNHYPTHKEDWDTYKKIVDGSKCTVIRTYREDSARPYWCDDEDRVQVLSPSLDMLRMANFDVDGIKRKPQDVDIDSISYALLINVNKRKIILAGDGKENVWNDIYEKCAHQISNCAILKAGHHGHECSFHEDALRLMNPEYIIFSNSEEIDNEHGASDKYMKVLPYSNLYKTSDNGTIVAKVPLEETVGIEFYKN